METIKTKKEAARLFGSQTAMARALGITRAAISRWHDDLTQRQKDEILGAAIRCGLIAYRPQDEKANFQREFIASVKRLKQIETVG